VAKLRIPMTMMMMTILLCFSLMNVWNRRSFFVSTVSRFYSWSVSWFVYITGWLATCLGILLFF